MTATENLRECESSVGNTIVLCSRCTFGYQEKVIGNDRVFIELAEPYSMTLSTVGDSDDRLTRTAYSCPSVSCRSSTCKLGLYGGMNGSCFTGSAIRGSATPPSGTGNC